LPPKKSKNFLTDHPMLLLQNAWARLAKREVLENQKKVHFINFHEYQIFIWDYYPSLFVKFSTYKANE